jgi:hypothetical protein
MTLGLFIKDGLDGQLSDSFFNRLPRRVRTLLGASISGWEVIDSLIFRSFSNGLSSNGRSSEERSGPLKLKKLKHSRARNPRIWIGVWNLGLKVIHDFSRLGHFERHRACMWRYGQGIRVRKRRVWIGVRTMNSGVRLYLFTCSEELLRKRPSK